MINLNLRKGVDPEKLAEELVKKVPEGDPLEHALKSNYDPIPEAVYKRIFTTYLKKDDNVLNLGSGAVIDLSDRMNHLNSTLMTTARIAGTHVINIDIDDNRLETNFAYKATHDDASHLSVVQADAMKLPFKEGSMAGVVSSNLINCPSEKITLRDQARIIVEEAYRVLQPGGFFLISSFGYVFEGYDESGVKFYNDYIKEVDIVKLRDLERILKDVGFVDIRDLEIDEDREKVAAKVRRLSGKHSVEAGGFLAFKPNV